MNEVICCNQVDTFMNTDWNCYGADAFLKKLRLFLTGTKHVSLQKYHV